MSDALKVAEQRRNEYKMAITKKENEIVELKERIEDLDNFLEFGQALVANGGDASSARGDTSSARPTPAAPAAEPKKVEANQQPKPAMGSKDDNEWDDQDDENAPSVGIARVLSKRTG